VDGTIRRDGGLAVPGMKGWFEGDVAVKWNGRKCGKEVVQLNLVTPVGLLSASSKRIR